MVIATTLRYVDLKAGGAWDNRMYIMHDYLLMARRYGVGLMAVMAEQDIDRLCECCDGLIIPGSGTDINPKYWGGEPMEKPQIVDEYYLDAYLLKRFFEAGKPIFGICGGHQAINVFLGGNIRKMADPGGHYDKETKSHPINIVKGSFVYDVFGKERATVNCYHGWEIGKLAPDLKCVATTDDGVIEAVEWRERNIYATQWHPEQSFHTGDPVENNFFANFLKRCEECK